MVDVTANATVFPSANDVAVVPKTGRFATEQKYKDYVQSWIDDHVRSGLTLSNPGGLVVDVAAGDAMIDAQLVEINATISITLVGDATHHIYLQLSEDVNLDIDGVDLISNTIGGAVVRSVKLGRVIVSGGVITSLIDDRNSNIIKPDGVNSRALDILRFNGSNASTAIGTILVSLISKTFALGNLRGRTNPAKFLVMGSGYIVDATVAGSSRNITMRLRLNTSTIIPQVIRSDGVLNFLAFSAAFSLHDIFSIDPTIANTIELTGETSAGSVTITESRLTIIEIGD